jgi:copper chaperone
MQEVQLAISGMSCGACVAHVREALTSVAGATVKDVQIGRAQVLLDPAQANVATLIDAVQDAGYEAQEAA